MNYVWQHKHWPSFSYDSDKLSGSLSQTDQDDSIAAQLDLMVDEAINTSLIEGENMNPASVRSSLQNYLNLTPTPINVANVKAEGVAALIVDVRKHFNQPLSKEMLLNWHRMLFYGTGAGFEDNILHSELTVGQWRDSLKPMQIVSGDSLLQPGYERVHYEVPAAQDLDTLMTEFLNWFNQQGLLQNNQQIPGVIRASIAHLWFEVIHPFDDGNGRIGRAIIEYALAQGLGMPVVLSMSTHIERNKKEYHRQLNVASCCDTSELDDPEVLNITSWLSWFIETLIAAQQEAAEKIATIFEKTEFWQRHKNTKLSERQKTILNKTCKTEK